MSVSMTTEAIYNRRKARDRRRRAKLDKDIQTVIKNKCDMEDDIELMEDIIKLHRRLIRQRKKWLAQHMKDLNALIAERDGH